MPHHKTYFNWSTGKDSALALYYLLQDKKYNVEYLLTAVNTHYNRVSMHGLRTRLLEQQIAAIDIPGGILELPEQPANAEYEMLMKQKVTQLKAMGFEYAAFGDIFLEDLRQYRERQLEPLGMKTIFPLWQKDSRQLMEEFIALGFKAITVCVNAELLDQSFAGRVIDNDFINSLPNGVDACGENGEFHTFCFDGPVFKFPIRFSIGETVFKEYGTEETKNGFWFCDLLPVD
ncbi:diphthine--ammonia ligase (plasmid) [Pedobacter sp. BS3]|uniref:Dph6-related ATP pyrophosphatase n=1 Tax=Pedobacter sp. BS3 TaxID=2567937 RepID=UPI0011EC667D|nr:diphthine--ammonia ligase [Pedobacter sp. BS3]TZF86153.1 diphthine--ammonia ligase [Pedobacter sp. BS3]